MAHVACSVGDGLFPLQRILKLRNGQEQASEEFFDMGLVHEDTDVPVIAVPGQRDVVKGAGRDLLLPTKLTGIASSRWSGGGQFMAALKHTHSYIGKTFRQFVFPFFLVLEIGEVIDVI